MKTLATLLFSASLVLLAIWLWEVRDLIKARLLRWLQSFDLDCDYPPNRVMFDVSLAFLLCSFLLLMSGAGWASFLALPLCLLAPYLRRKIMIKRHRHALQEQIPDFCEFLAAAVRAGVGIRSALDELQSQVGQPLSRELGKIRNEQRLGVSVSQSFDRWMHQADAPALRDVSFCIRISQESGGALGESLVNTARSIRQGRLVQEKAKALSSQGQLQAIIMMAIPPLVLVAVASIDPFTFDFFFRSYPGMALLGLVAALEVLGYRWIQAIVRVE